LPQIVAAALGGAIMSGIGWLTNYAATHYNLVVEGNSQIIMLVIAGVALLLGALTVPLISDKRENA
jgi:hypothetical protein